VHDVHAEDVVLAERICALVEQVLYDRLVAADGRERERVRSVEPVAVGLEERADGFGVDVATGIHNHLDGVDIIVDNGKVEDVFAYN